MVKTRIINFSNKKKMKKRSKGKETTQERLRKWREYYSKIKGVYVLCSSCAKWRFINNLEQGNVPEDWKCSNGKTGDGLDGHCEMETCFSESNMDESDFQFVPGDLVWAKQEGYPWWPGMVEDDPDVEEYALSEEDSSSDEMFVRKGKEAHITFFGINFNRSWIHESKIVSYEDGLKNHEMLFKGYLNYRKAKHYMFLSLRKAVCMADDAIRMSHKDRLENYSFAEKYAGKFPPARKEVLELQELKMGNPQKLHSQTIADVAEKKGVSPRHIWTSNYLVPAPTLELKDAGQKVLDIYFSLKKRKKGGPKSPSVATPKNSRTEVVQVQKDKKSNTKTKKPQAMAEVPKALDAEKAKMGNGETQKPQRKAVAAKEEAIHNRELFWVNDYTIKLTKADSDEHISSNFTAAKKRKKLSRKSNDTLSTSSPQAKKRKISPKKLHSTSPKRCSSEGSMSSVPVSNYIPKPPVNNAESPSTSEINELINHNGILNNKNRSDYIEDGPDSSLSSVSSSPPWLLSESDSEQSALNSEETYKWAEYQPPAPKKQSHLKMEDFIIIDNPEDVVNCEESVQNGHVR